MFDNLTYLEYLTLILIGLLFFREDIMPWVKGFFGFKTQKPASSDDFDNLADHVNHRQTEILEKQTEILQQIKEGIENVNRKHEEWEKYGINTRCSVRKKA